MNRACCSPSLLLTCASFLSVCLAACAEDQALTENLMHPVANVSKACIEPTPMVRWQDYEGPLQSVSNIARKFDHPPDPAPNYKPDTLLCSLAVKDKFRVFVRHTLDPMSFVSVSFNAGIDQLTNRDPSFGRGTRGYAKRFGADLADQTSWRFLVDFAYPVVFSEDPRYYRLGQGSLKRRLLHASTHVVIAHHDDGRPMFNYSEWLGTSSAIAISHLYQPGSHQGIDSVAQQVGFVVVQDLGMDLFKEFWPDIVRKMHMPFRDPGESPRIGFGR
jgi:hypothetical protein